MIVPGGNSDFDFYQSSNRMVIERAFGVLVRRWGVFWRPLEVAFDRRAPLIGAAMKLHNLCINLKIDVSLQETGGATEIGVDRRGRRVYGVTPEFDEDGSPVEFLDTNDTTPDDTGRSGRRNELAAILQGQGLKRPGESAREAALRGRRANANSVGGA